MNSKLIIDDNYTTSDFANNFFELFEQHNSDLISNFIQQVYENGGTHSDIVILGNLINERFYAEWLFQATQEVIKRNYSKAKNEGQIYG